MMRRRVLCAVVAIGAAAAVAACGGSESADTTTSGGSASASPLDGQRIAFANFTEGAPQFVTLRENLERYADELGVELELYDNKADPKTTATNARLMAQQKPDAILEYNPVASVAPSLEAIFERAGVSCIAVNIPGAGRCPWFNLSNQQLCGDTGRYIGSVADRRRWTGENTSVLLVQAAAAGAPVNSCIGFFYEQLQEQVPGLARIASYRDITPQTTTVGDTTVQVDGAALRDASFKAVGNALQNIPEDRNLIVYTVSDDSALGAWRAVERAGRARQTLTGGLVGGEEALRELRTNPQWVAQGTVFYESWGQYLLAMAAAIEDGIETPAMTSSPVAVLTKDERVPDTSIVPIDDYYRDGESLPYRLPPLEPVREGETSGLGPGTVGNEYLAETGVLQLLGDVQGLR